MWVSRHLLDRVAKGHRRRWMQLFANGQPTDFEISLAAGGWTEKTAAKYASECIEALGLESRSQVAALIAFHQGVAHARNEFGEDDPT